MSMPFIVFDPFVYVLDLVVFVFLFFIFRIFFLILEPLFSYLFDSFIMNNGNNGVEIVPPPVKLIQKVGHTPLQGVRLGAVHLGIGTDLKMVPINPLKNVSQNRPLKNHSRQNITFLINKNSHGFPQYFLFLF